MSKYELSLIRIFPYVDGIVSISPRIWTESLRFCPDTPIWTESERFCPDRGKYGYDSVHVPENMDKRKPVFWHISRHVLLNIFSHNLDLRQNISFVSAKIIHAQIYELFNCAKIKGAKINCAKIRSTRNFMGLSYVYCNCLLPRLWRHDSILSF